MLNRVALCRACDARGSLCRFGADEIVALGPTEALVSLRCPETFEGGPQVAHGGWTAAAFDDVMGRFLTHSGRRTVTATLTISYKAPVPVETPLELKVRIQSNEGRRWTVTGELRLQGDDLELATAEGVWIERRPDHFDRHEHRLAEYRRSQIG